MDRGERGREPNRVDREPDIAGLRRWNTPTIYNGWEALTRTGDRMAVVNAETVVDFMPEMGPLAGYAATVVIEPGNPSHAERGAELWAGYRSYIASLEGPTVVVVQDLDKPAVRGSFWGEVSAGIHRSLGCVGTIVDGAIRDLEDMQAAGFKALARRLCVGHAWSTPVRWDVEVEVFGTAVRPGQLIHADKHGFIAVPDDDVPGLLEAARFMDELENRTVIPAGRQTAGLSRSRILENFNAAAQQFAERADARFGRPGEHTGVEHDL